MGSHVGARLGRVQAGGSAADIWVARVGEHLARLDDYGRDLLSGEERRRAGGYRSRESAERYVVTRALVRAVLSEHLGVAPAVVDVRLTERGKPVLAHAPHFNVSHSGDLILLAVCETRAVGVDVERRRHVDRVGALVDRWLSAVERGDVARLQATGLEASEAFLRVWSLKEARLKALGVGIAGAGAAVLDQVEAAPLDEVLDSLPERESAGFVGAVAFA